MYNDFRIDSDIIDSLNNSLNGLDTSMSDLLGECGGKMTSLSKIPGFDSAISAVNKQMSEVSNEINSIKGSVKQQASEMFDLDIGTAKIAEQIEIPTDFSSNDSIVTNYYQNNALKKNDGRSVNEGTTAHQENMEDINGTKQGLTNISGDHTQIQNYDATSAVAKESAFQSINGNSTQEQKYDATSAVAKESAFQNIDGNRTETQNYDATSAVAKENAFQNIDGNNTQEQKYDESSNVSKEGALKNIDGNRTENQNYDATSNVSKNDNLKAINGTQAKEETYNNNVSINSQNLSNINTNNAVNYNNAVNVAAEENKKINEKLDKDDVKESSGIGLGLGAAAAGLGIAASMIGKDREEKEEETQEEQESKE